MQRSLPGDGEFRRELALLDADFSARLPARIREISHGCRRLLSGAITATELEPLRIDVHKLAGSGTIYGSPEISAAARALERSIKEAAAGRPFPTDRISAELAELDGAVERRLAGTRERPGG